MTAILTHDKVQQPAGERLPPLENGDHLDRATFHARYEAMPLGTRAELIFGEVHMPSPMHLRHGRADYGVIRWLGEYEDLTPGIEAVPGVTTLLGDDSEVQPDCALRIAYGGQSTADEDGPLVGPPELMIEIASSTAAIDLHRKKRLYQETGVREYIVVRFREPGIHWFALRGSSYEELRPGQDGIYRSEVFPGLWLDAQALLRRDMKRVREVVAQGCATPEHAKFVSKLTGAAE